MAREVSVRMPGASSRGVVPAGVGMRQSGGMGPGWERGSFRGDGWRWWAQVRARASPGRSFWGNG
jgi:hypothetical protein